MVGPHTANSYHLLRDFLAANCVILPNKLCRKGIMSCATAFPQIRNEVKLSALQMFLWRGSECGKREEMPLNFSKCVEHTHFHDMMVQWHFTHCQLI